MKLIFNHEEDNKVKKEISPTDVLINGTQAIVN